MLNGNRFIQNVRDLIQIKKNASKAEAILATALESMKVAEMRIKEMPHITTGCYYFVHEHDHYGDIYSVYIDEDGEPIVLKLEDPEGEDDSPTAAPPLMTAPKVDTNDVPFNHRTHK